MNNDFYVKVAITKEEWDTYTVEEKKRFLGRLSAIDVWVSQYLLQCLQAYEKQHAAEKTISIKKTFDYYYGDEK